MNAAATPIRRRLSNITVITTGVALLMTSVLFLAGQVLAVRRSSLQELRILTEVLATNSSAALAFDNPEDGRNVLSAFKADPHIVAAALYREDGQLFVSYPSHASPGAVPATAAAPGYHFEGSSLIGIATVSESERPLGTLYVRSDMRPVYDRVMYYALMSAVVIGLALLAAWFIARRLQRQLSEPILQLAATAREVSDQLDYRVRASPVGINELDDLTHAFNHMLGPDRTIRAPHGCAAGPARPAAGNHAQHRFAPRPEQHLPGGPAQPRRPPSHPLRLRVPARCCGGVDDRRDRRRGQPETV